MDMTTDSADETPEPATGSELLLTRVLKQSEHVNELMKQSGEELTGVNRQIREELAIGGWPGIEAALANSAAVESKLQDASAQLTALNQVLENEVRNRTLVDHQLAAAIEQEESARNAAFHDVLTGLPNRALFKDRLEHGIAQAKRYRWTLAVMFLDLDKFKEINDTYGHQVGDAVLRTMAKRLKDNARDDDTVSRRSGDEFLCLLTQIHEQKDIVMIAQKILKAVQAPCEGLVAGATDRPSVAASMGISIFPKDGVTAEALIKRADQAMYRAKQNKSGYEFAHEGLAPSVRLRTDAGSSTGVK
jgi:diguanylate cyclase (GGDEF)-like protein